MPDEVVVGVVALLACVAVVDEQAAAATLSEPSASIQRTRDAVGRVEPFVEVVGLIVLTFRFLLLREVALCRRVYW